MSFFAGSVFADGIEVDGDTEGCASLILAAVTPPNRPGLIVEDGHERSQCAGDLPRLGDQFGFVFQKRKDTALYGSHSWMEAENSPHLALAVLCRNHLFIVSFAKQGQGSSIDSRARLDNVGHKLLLCLLVEVFERLATEFNVPGEIVIGAVGNPFELADSERKVVFEIVCLLRIEGAFLVGNIVNADLWRGGCRYPRRT